MAFLVDCYSHFFYPICLLFSIVGCQNEIDVGDVLDDLFDRALRNIVKGSVSVMADLCL